MKQATKRHMGIGVAALTLVTMACTCGNFTSGLGQAQTQLQTAEALATGVATSGVIETAQAYATQGAAGTPVGGVVIGATEEATTDVSGNVNVGNVPDNIPVMDGAQNVVSASGAVTYTVSSDLKSVQDFYTKGMPDKGWTQSQDPVVLGDSVATLTYTNDTQQAVIGITSAGGQTTVAIAVTNK